MAEFTDVFDDITWVDKNYEELQTKYPNKYIVVKNQKVVVVADDFDTADKRASQILGSNVDYTVERIEIGDMDQKSEKRFTFWGDQIGSYSRDDEPVLGHSNGIGTIEFE